MNPLQLQQRTSPVRTISPQCGQGSTRLALFIDPKSTASEVVDVRRSWKMWPHSGHWAVSARIEELHPGQDRMTVDMISPCIAVATSSPEYPGSYRQAPPMVFKNQKLCLHTYDIQPLRTPLSEGLAFCVWESIESHFLYSKFGAFERTVHRLPLRITNFKPEAVLLFRTFRGQIPART